MSDNNSEFNLWVGRADAALAANRNDEALASLDKALTLRPHDPHALNSRGSLLGQMGRFEEAIAAFKAAAVERPSDAELHYNIAFALQSQGRSQEAYETYSRALQIRPAYPEALNNRGLVQDALGKSELAIKDFNSALKLDPRDKLALSNLGRCHLNQGEAAKAAPYFEKALTVDPGYPGAVKGLAAAYHILERGDKLAYVCQQLVAYAPNVAATWVEFGAALVTLNKRAEAEKHFAKALELAPDDADIPLRMARAWLEAGDLDAANAALAKAVELKPRSIYVLDMVTLLKKTVLGDGTLEKLTGLAADEKLMDLQQRAVLHFALGKALSDLGDNERAFFHVLDANQHQRARRRYDEAKSLRTIATTAKLFSPDILKRCRNTGNTAKAPIFILGMPRSGSTLVEQILAGHKHVRALGELKAMDEAIGALESKKDSPFPDWLPSLDREDIALLADRYLSRLWELAQAQGVPAGGPQLRLVDKMPGNFHYVGLIHLALPNAKIIHTRRDPLDTCLSCFEKYFEGLPYTNDLGELGRFYHHYEKLMAAWTRVLPPASFLDVDYHAVVTDFETSVRRILAYCDLEWDDACLAFHKAERSVRTASAAQVRQPLYTTSLKRWRPSDEILRPLLEGLRGDSPPDKAAAK